MKIFCYALAAFALLAGPVNAQWQVPNHSVPVGQGGGNIGFNSAAPGTAGQPLVSNGASADPSFQVVPSAGIAAGAVDNTKLANAPANTAKCNPTGGTAAVQDCTAAQLLALLPPTVVTSAPSITTNNCFAPVGLGGAALYTVSVGAASGFQLGCELTFTNTDPWPTGTNCSTLTGGHGKLLSVAGLSSLVLWPQQTYKFRNIANNWYPDPAYQRVVVPTGQKFCIDLAGSDTTGDGLGAGSGAFRTLSRAWFVAWQSFQSAGGSSTGGNADYDWRLVSTPSCVQSTGANCHSGIHFAGTLAGTEGHNAVMVECDSGSSANCAISDTTNAAVGLFNSGINLEIQNITLAAPANSLIQAERGMVRIQGGVVFGAASTSSAQLQANMSSGHIVIDNSSQINVTGGGGWLAAISGGGMIQLDGATFSFQNDVTYAQQTLAAQGFGAITENSTSWVLNGHTITAAHNVACSPGGIVQTSGAVASVPGTNSPIGCTLNNNGTYN